MFDVLVRRALCVLALLAVGSPSFAATITVPQMYPTIGLALGAAKPGDTILVGPGIYYERLSWPSFDGIRLIATEGPDVTFIDGAQNGRVVSFSLGQTRATLLRGFTITGGRNRTTGFGGGIYAYGEVRIVNNTIAENRCRAAMWSRGGAYFGEARAVLANNIVVGNFARGVGGIYTRGNAVIELERNNVWQNQNGDYGNVSPGANDLSVDPMFKAPGYGLAPSSPLIDQGNTSELQGVIGMDVEGDARILDGDASMYASIDIGADEFSFARLSLSGPPKLGLTVAFDVSGPLGASWSLLLSPTKANVVIQPIGNVLIGSPNLLLAAGRAPGRAPVAIPNLPSLTGQSVYTQAVVAYDGGPKRTVHTTGRLELTLFQ